MTLIRTSFIFCENLEKDGNNLTSVLPQERPYVQHLDILHTCLNRRILPFSVLLKGSFENSLKDIPFYGSAEHQRESAF